MRTAAIKWLTGLFASQPDGPAASMRWVVLDCESSGLDPRNDRLLSIGAVTIESARVAVNSGFSVVLRQNIASDSGNILVHGITGEEQTSGVAGTEALAQFASYAADSPLVAFHAQFDRALLIRAMHGAGMRLRNRWLDLADLAPALYPEQAKVCKSLDDWLGRCGIENPSRHDALSDAYATAQLFQVLLEKGRTQGADTCAEMLQVAKTRQWLSSGY